MLRDSRSTDATIPASDTEVGPDALAASSSHNMPHFEGECSGTQRGCQWNGLDMYQPIKRRLGRHKRTVTGL